MLTFGNKKNFDESTLQPSTDLNALNTLRYPCVAPQITTDFNALNTPRYLCFASLSELLLHLPAYNKPSICNKPSSNLQMLIEQQTFIHSTSIPMLINHQLLLESIPGIKACLNFGGFILQFCTQLIT